ncbi:ferritin-like domain-containing protein [uncultured Jatrophihabitans sp.]|uniref:ferritin-like domain-containing protein n=1 Tax=uncultured Jatrophihabitans sp. TaxID=1610747 RepID=UPI0035CB21EB
MSGSVTAARQAALAAELRALYGYALIGPRLPAADQQLARECIAAHTVLRDTTTAVIAASGSVPVTPLADYPELYPIADLATARARAVYLEQTCADAWRFLYARLAASTGTDRSPAQRALSESAVRATRWRLRAGDPSPTVPFPGIS